MKVCSRLRTSQLTHLHVIQPVRTFLDPFRPEWPGWDVDGVGESSDSWPIIGSPSSASSSSWLLLPVCDKADWWMWCDMVGLGGRGERVGSGREEGTGIVLYHAAKDDRFV